MNDLNPIIPKQRSAFQSIFCAMHAEPEREEWGIGFKKQYRSKMSTSQMLRAVGRSTVAVIRYFLAFFLRYFSCGAALERDLRSSEVQSPTF